MMLKRLQRRSKESLAPNDRPNGSGDTYVALHCIIKFALHIFLCMIFLYVILPVYHKMRYPLNIIIYSFRPSPLYLR